jgi:hypothetical protein
MNEFVYEIRVPREDIAVAFTAAQIEEQLRNLALEQFHAAFSEQSLEYAWWNSALESRPIPASINADRLEDITTRMYHVRVTARFPAPQREWFFPCIREGVVQMCRTAPEPPGRADEVSSAVSILGARDSQLRPSTAMDLVLYLQRGPEHEALLLRDAVLDAHAHGSLPLRIGSRLSGEYGIWFSAPTRSARLRVDTERAFVTPSGIVRVNTSRDSSLGIMPGSATAYIEGLIAAQSRTVLQGLQSRFSFSPPSPYGGFSVSDPDDSYDSVPEPLPPRAPDPASPSMPFNTVQRRVARGIRPEDPAPPESPRLNLRGVRKPKS